VSHLKETDVKLRLIVSALIILLAALVAADAFAEDATSPTPSPAPTTPAAPAAAAKFYLEVDQSDLSAISQALNELPKRVADPLILKLNGQLQAQEQLKAAADKSLSEPVDKAKKRK
jgi:membrane-bound ClpP family serine protease